MFMALERTAYSPILLAVDLGLHTGLAWFDHHGYLLKQQSKHLSRRQDLKKLIRISLHNPTLEWIILEGGGWLAKKWIRETQRTGLAWLEVNAETWRKDLLWPRERKSKTRAKKNALLLAQKVLLWSKKNLLQSSCCPKQPAPPSPGVKKGTTKIPESFFHSRSGPPVPDLGPELVQHDAAEAILVGFWAVIHLGWLPKGTWKTIRRT